ncbi:MAG: FeoB-associated Cys-rich membrane protein [Clostridiaceae bacterium]
MEFLFGAAIIGCAGYILFKNLKKKTTGGGCDCGSCSSHCPQYDDKK